MSYPHAWIYAFSGSGIDRVSYEQTEHYKVTNITICRILVPALFASLNMSSTPNKIVVVLLAFFALGLFLAGALLYCTF